MLNRMVLKRALDEMGILENAMKKQSSKKSGYCGISVVVLN